MRHRKHVWGVKDGAEVCGVCGKDRDQAAASRSRSSVRLGKDVERRLAKRFGWRKVGHLGDAVDLLGHTVKVQSKATRGEPPAWLSAVDGIGTIFGAPGYVTEPMAKMDPLYPDKFPVLALSYVHAGRPTATWLVVRYEDLLATWGEQWAPWAAYAPTHVVMDADYWLDMAGQHT